MQRVGRFAQPPVLLAIGMPEGSDLWRYRTVAQFAVGPDGAIGFRRANSRDVLDMPTCPLVHPALDTLYQTIRAWIRGHWGGAAFVPKAWVSTFDTLQLLFELGLDPASEPTRAAITPRWS